MLVRETWLELQRKPNEIMKTVKAVMIDVTNREVKEVTITPELSTYYELIECELVQLAPLDQTCGEIVAFIDEEAKLKNPQKDYFKFDGCYEPYCGNAVVVGAQYNYDDEDGDDTIDVPNGIFEKIKSSINFYSPEELDDDLTDPTMTFYILE